MSTAELTAHRIYDTYRLGELSDEVKRQLVILFKSSTSPENHAQFSYTDALESLSGAWADNGLTAEEEIADIYNARQSGITRKDIEL